MSKDYLVVFEDEDYSRFYPISLSRPVYEILAGTKSNLDRIRHHFSDFKIFTLGRPYLSDLFNISGKGKIEELIDAQFDRLILVNGNIVFRSQDRDFINELKNGGPAAYIKDGRLLASVLSSKEFRDLSEDILSLYSEGRSRKIIESSKRIEEVNILTFSYIWDPVLLNQELIESDFNEYFKDKSQGPLGDSFIYGRDRISVCGDLSADHGSVIDARGGPVIIGKGVKIKPFTYLEGPAFVGDGCILVGGKIRGSSLGSGCRIGGEVENSIIIANSNKCHEGFIGHAYIGEWVNLGALTTNSDLKNDYSQISIKQNGVVSRGRGIKIGCFIGDHTKTGIGTTLNTGVVIGFSCNLFGATLILEKEVPSFAWGNDSLRHSLPLKKAIGTAREVMRRRGFKFEDRDESLFRYLFDESRVKREIWSNS